MKLSQESIISNGRKQALFTSNVLIKLDLRHKEFMQKVLEQAEEDELSPKELESKVEREVQKFQAYRLMILEKHMISNIEFLQSA